MANLKISALTADATPSSDDLVVTVNDPGGTPANRKVTLANLSLGLGAASATAQGAVELATTAETTTGTDDTRAVTPKGLTDGFQGSANITTLGTIGTGTWQSTDIGVQYGGTGASTLTDHGVLFGSGTGAITASAAPTNGQLVIGNTGSDPSIATLTAGDSVQITNGGGTITFSVNPLWQQVFS